MLVEAPRLLGWGWVGVGVRFCPEGADWDCEVAQELLPPPARSRLKAATPLGGYLCLPDPPPALGSPARPAHTVPFDFWIRLPGTHNYALWPMRVQGGV